VQRGLLLGRLGACWELQRQISSLAVGVWRSLRITLFGTYQGASTIMPKALKWKCVRIYVLEVEAVPQSCIPYIRTGFSIVLYVRSFLLVESFHLCPSNQNILVRVIPSCFCFAKMCLCQVSLLSRCSTKYLTSSPWGSCTTFIWTGGYVSLQVVNVTWTYLDLLAFILHILNQFWITARLVCRFLEAMASSLSMASTAV
jgi:hypothetical protein